MKKKMGTIEPIANAKDDDFAKDKLQFIRGAIAKYSRNGVDRQLLNYIERQVDVEFPQNVKPWYQFWQ